jgi:hypothetical protein
LDKLSLVKIHEDSAMDYVKTMIGALEVICGSLVGQGPFVTVFCILELFHQLVNCLYGNERYSKSRLLKSRGFGLHEEFFTNEVALSVLGLKMAFRYLQQFTAFFSGEQKKQCFALILACLYYNELTNLPDEIISAEFITKNITLIQGKLKILSDDKAMDIEHQAISIKQFVDIYSRKYRRNLLKTHAVQVFYETYIDSRGLQEELCNANLVLYLVHAGQFLMFESKNLNSALTFIKQWLKVLQFEELATLWYQYAIKKMPVLDRDQTGLSTIDTLITLSCRDIQTNYGIDIFRAFEEPDTVAR